MTPLLTVDEAAPILNVPVTWLRKAATDRNFPCTRVGRYVRFTEEDLAEIVARGRRDRRAAA
jgi:excisionase family DNA binding protein